MRYRKCEICHGRSERKDGQKRFFMARFPLNGKRCKEWVKATGVEDLVYIPIEKLNQLKFICGKHFKPSDFTRKKTQLKRTAVPTVGICSKPLPDELFSDFPLYIARSEPDPPAGDDPNSTELTKKQRAYDHSYSSTIIVPTPADSIPHDDSHVDDNVPTEGLESTDDALPLETDATDTQMITVQDGETVSQEEVDFLPKTVCRICLRPRLPTADIHDALAEYYAELVYFDEFEHDDLTVCSYCDHELRKAYNFRQKCRRAHVVLKEWSENHKKMPLTSLHKNLPRSPLGMINTKSVNKMYEFELPEHLNDPPIAEEVNKEDEIADEAVTEDVDMKTESVHDENDNYEVDDTIGDNDFNNDNAFSSDESHTTDIWDKFFGTSKKDKENVKVEMTSGIEPENVNASVKAESTGLKTHFIGNKIRYLDRKIRLKDLNEEERKQRSAILKRNNLLRRKAELKEYLCKQLDREEFQGMEYLGVVLDKETLAKLVDKCPISTLIVKGMKRRDSWTTEKLQNFFNFLLKRYNPDYDTIFDIEFLDTYEQKVAEFQSRQFTKDYIEAHHKCEICFKIFEVENLLKWHQQWHNPELPVVCSICNMRFKEKKTLGHHNINNHANVYRCKHCPFVNTCTDRMRDHYFEHKGSEYACPICHKVFKNRSTMNNHRRIGHKTENLCPFCARSFVSDHGLTLHFKLKHHEVPADYISNTPPTKQCEQCNGAFYTEVALQKHVDRAHTDLGKVLVHKCFFCKETFNTMEELLTHKLKKEHRGVRRKTGEAAALETHITCPLCQEKILKSKGKALYHHYRSAHPTEPYETSNQSRNYLCEHCGKGFQSNNHYKDHLNTHTGEKPYECSECGARFASRSLAKIHVGRHGAPTYPCRYCDKALHTLSARHRHEKIHIGQRKHACPHCDKAFLYSSSLKLHMSSVHYNLRKTKIKTRRKTNAPAIQHTANEDELTVKDGKLYYIPVKQQSVNEDESVKDDELYFIPIKEQHSVNRDEITVKEGEIYYIPMEQHSVKEDELSVKEDEASVHDDDASVDDTELSVKDQLSVKNEGYFEAVDEIVYTQYVVGREEVIEASECDSV